MNVICILPSSGGVNQKIEKLETRVSEIEGVIRTGSAHINLTTVDGKRFITAGGVEYKASKKLCIE